jgi:hypothetical protein
LLGSAANADAQNANVSTTLAQRIDEPDRRLNPLSIRMPYRDSVSNFAQPYLEDIQDKKQHFQHCESTVQKYFGRCRWLIASFMILLLFWQGLHGVSLLR